MNPPNTAPSDVEANNIPKETKIFNTYGLLKSGIEREFGNPMDPRKFDTYKKNKERNKENIRTHMRDIRSENKEEWSGVTDTMIDTEATDANISEQILRMSQDLVFKRKRIYDRSIELFPSISDSEREILRGEIAGYNENELHNFMTRNSALRKMIYGVFPGLRGASPSEHKDFDVIFHDKDNYFDQTEQRRLEKIFHDYYQFDRIPDWEDIDFILGKYSATTVSDIRRKEILTVLGVTLTIKDAIGFNLIDETFLENFSQKWFEELYDQLDTPAKKSFIRGLSYNTSYLIPAADFSENSLGVILSQKSQRRKLAEQVFRSVAMDMPEEQEVNKKRNTDPVVARITERKKKEAEEANQEFREIEYDLYDEVIEELKISSQNSPGKPSRIENIDNLKKNGAVIQFTHTDGSTQYVRVVAGRNPDGSPCESMDGTENCVKLEGFNVIENRLGSPQPFNSSYETFLSFLLASQGVRILTAEEFENKLTSNMSEVGEGSDKIYDARTIETDPVTAVNISSKLDLIDSEGSKFGFEKGTSFRAPVSDKDGKRQNEDGIWTIKNIHPANNTIDLIDPWGNNSENGLPLDQVYAVILQNAQGFKRVSKIQDDTELVKQLGKFGVDGIKDGNLLIKSKDSHGKEEEKNITCFSNEEGGHIRMQSIQDGTVRFGEFDGTDIQKAKAYAEKNGIDQNVKGLYNWRQMSYSEFLAYLDKNKLKASKEDKIVKEASHNLHDDGHGHHPHVHGSFMSRVFQMQNPKSLWKGFELIIHGIEHTLEKGAKLDAAKFALSTSKFLGLPDTVSSQIYSDVVEGSKEIVEKYEKKIFGLPGPRGRIKCLHIVENLDSRPEEVVAAMSYMLKNYGNLYGENMKHKQSYVKSKEHCINAPKGTFMFFDAFVISSKMGPLAHWREEAYTKAITEMGTEEDHENEPTEEQLIHALIKKLDGKWDKHPYAASVARAIGGPGGFEKLWKFEGYDNAKKKGRDQTMMVNAQGRLNKAVSYLDTHEIYKGIGAMEAVIMKIKEPKYSAFPFVWAVGGFTRYASHAALQDIKAYAEQSCYSFHAFSFLRKYDDNKTYKKVVRLAMEKKGGKELANKFDSICARLEKNPDNPKYTDNAAQDMMKLWQENCNGEDGLHNMLQGHNGWLMSQLQSGNPDVKQYINTIEDKHQMKLDSPSIEGDLARDYYNEWGYVDSRIFSFNKETNLLSLQRQLNKIGLKGTKTGDREMSDDDYKKLWAGVVNQMNVTRNLKYFSTKTGDREINEDTAAIALQKEQFRAYRQEIINIYVTRLNARSTKLSPEEIDNILALPHKYWNDIAKMGIDPHAVFDESLDKSNFEVDYERWKKGTKYELKTTNSGGKQVFDIASHFQQTAEKVQNPQNGTGQDQMVPKPNIPRQSESPKTHHIPKDDGDEELVYET